jgi:murein DD-endopeptidase MepM/ murein hydrolase activator NlpD
MRRLTLTCALLFALAPAAAAQPTDIVPRAAPAAVHPVGGDVGYGEWAARFGNFRHGHVHAGQDVFAPAGTPLLAIRDAVVIEKGSGDGRGNYVAMY